MQWNESNETVPCAKIFLRFSSTVVLVNYVKPVKHHLINHRADD